MSIHERTAVEIGPRQPGQVDDRVQVRSISFETELLLGRILLDGDYRLEYLPVVESGQSDGWAIEFAVQSLSGTEVVHRRRPLAALDRNLIGHSRLGATKAVERADLSRWKDQWVTLSWRLVSTREFAGPPPAAHVARLTLTQAEPADTQPPDILVICSDTHRFDHSAGELNGRPLMPNLDRFAKTGVRFDATTAPSPWTLPSVASLLTGLYPRFHRTGYNIETTTIGEETRALPVEGGHFRVQWGDKNHVFTTFPAEIDTMAERLGRRGYATYAVSANGLLRLSGLGQQGADLFWSLGQSRAPRIEGAVAALAPMLELERPLFLYVHLLDAHEYHFVDEAELEGVEGSSSADLQRMRYLHQIEVVDGAVGRLIDWWDRMVGREDSLVVFYSDHGEHLSDPGGPKHGHGITLQEVLLHVPMVVRFPFDAGVAPSVVHSQTSLVDVAATIDDLVFGGPSREPYLGRSLLDVSNAAASGKDVHRPLFADYMLMGDELSAVRSGRHKLVVNLSQGNELLFDLSRGTEFGEPTQLVDDVETRDALAVVFERYLAAAAATADHLTSDHAPDPEDVRSQLKALGYVSP